MGSNVGSNMSSGNIHKLSALKIKKIRKARRSSDGNCLYLVIKDTGARQWVLCLVIRGKRHDMGLGSSTASAVSRTLCWKSFGVTWLGTQRLEFACCDQGLHRFASKRRLMHIAVVSMARRRTVCVKSIRPMPMF